MTPKSRLNRLKNILITVATANEVSELIRSKSRKLPAPGASFRLLDIGDAVVDLLITGPGIHATTYFLTKQLDKKKYDLVLNIGICGSLDPAVVPVRLVRITTDQFADLGAEDGSKFLSMFELGFEKPGKFPFKKGKLHETFSGKLESLSPIIKTNGITVNKSHGTKASVLQARSRFGRVMESMEGAAVFFVCTLEHVPCLQVRAVSNMVEKRNRKKWKVQEAIDALAGFTGLFLMEWTVLNANFTK